MPLVTVVAGRYVGSYASTSVGITHDDGYTLMWTPHYEPVNATDAYGQSLVEGVYRGADYRMQFRSIEFSTGSMRPAWPFGNDGSSLGNRMGIIARLMTGMASPMVLTSTAGTPAATSPATLTAPLSIASPNMNFSTMFTSKVRTVPVELSLIPDTAGGNITWYSVT